MIITSLCEELSVVKVLHVLAHSPPYLFWLFVFCHLYSVSHLCVRNRKIKKQKIKKTKNQKNKKSKNKKQKIKKTKKQKIKKSKKQKIKKTKNQKNKKKSKKQKIKKTKKRKFCFLHLR